ncbi:hypothetical protein ACQ4PT_039194 [Festuca glaucescens]
MTVRATEGDSSGDSATPPPATVRKVREDGVSPELPLGGRFWALQPPDEEEDGDTEAISEVEVSETFRYLCRTPSLAGDRDISEDTVELARRARKRIERQKNQRMAAMAAFELSASAGTLSPSLMPLGMSVGKAKIKSMPVLEPSVFMDDDMDGWTVVRRRHWSPVISSEAHDSRKVGISKNYILGSDRHRAGANLDRARWGLVIQRNHAPAVVQAPRATGVHRSHQARVGNQVAGRALRKILGLAWRKVESGESILPRRSSAFSMNGDGGQGGFNPSRGGFHAGRGGYQGRGGCGAARGANGARGRQHHGGGRGGHGFGAGQGYGGGRGTQGNAPNNGTAGMNGGQGYQQENWGGVNANYQRAKGENPKLAKVTVDGDAMTIPEIIEQLKRIVPYEKFNWEVFHFKDNIFRVKLPSKQEVQRFKNFEVWVQVAGLPSDMRSDYLSLWGVGTLFGKTLDVDMAYTRKNKVLRTKIGCLDRSLIPADSDVFIRRGFYKLHFEVKVAQGSQEVNMVDANNGNDGNDDAQHGEKKYGGGHAMDMDQKGNDGDATSNNNDQDASNVNNGVEGMQEQLHNIDAIQIGTMHVKIAPKDSAPRKLSSGSVFVGARAACPQPASGQQGLHTARASGQQRSQAASGQHQLHAAVGQ